MANDYVNGFNAYKRTHYLFPYKQLELGKRMAKETLQHPINCCNYKTPPSSCAQVMLVAHRFIAINLSVGSVGQKCKD